MSHSRNSPLNLHFISWGAAGFVFKVTDHIVLKHARTPGNKRIEHEHRVFDLLEGKPPCPSIICSFLRLPDYNFLEYMAGVNLEGRLRARQTRGPANEFVTVNSLEPPNLVSRWMAELTSAAAWLEGFGLVHGDIRPSNLLLDSRDHLKLTDFDSVAEVGHDLEAGAPPYARLQGPEASDDCWMLGSVGHRTEQFAIGSVFYYLTRGYEPYEDSQISGPRVVDLLQSKQFPEIEVEDVKDAIIKKCWHGEFVSVKQLAAEVGLLHLDEAGHSESLSKALIEERRKECRESYSSWKPHTDDLVAQLRVLLPNDQ